MDCWLFGRPSQVLSIMGIPSNIWQGKTFFFYSFHSLDSLPPTALFFIYCLSHFSPSFNATTDTMHDQLPQKKESYGFFSPVFNSSSIVLLLLFILLTAATQIRVWITEKSPSSHIIRAYINHNKLLLFIYDCIWHQIQIISFILSFIRP